MSSISFISDGEKISGNLFLAKKPLKFAFLLIQGWTGRQNMEAAQSLADLGFTSMTYDMRGNGDSQGDISALSRADFLRDATIAYDFLKQQVGEQTQIGVVGSSFGSYTAVLLSQQRQVAALSLRVPANYPDEGFNEPHLAHKYAPQDFAEWRKKKYTYTENFALAALHDFGGKVQIVESGADETVTHQVVESYVDAVQDKQLLSYSIMEDAPHSLVNEQLQQEYVGLLARWAAQFVHA